MSHIQKLESIYVAALEISTADGRSAYLDAACHSDPELRHRIERMLAANSNAGSFLQSPHPALAGVVCGDVVTEGIQPITLGPGSHIGPYKLLQQIGEGGFGIVYMAEQQHPVRRKVALKIIKPGMDTKEVIARFESERQALALMDHPHIAHVLEAGATKSGRPFFVMELVKGAPITQYCYEHQLTHRQRLELFVQVCQAIQHAHQKGIIHRDIKPSNILVAEYDQQPVPKVIDFGVAKATSQPLTEKTMFTGFGQVIGTLEYMSPEQAKVNQLDIDTRSDIYSLGVVLYELLTGCTPFDRARLRSAAWDEMLLIIREEEPPKPSTRLARSRSVGSVSNSSAPTGQSSVSSGYRVPHLLELDWIVMKALEKDRGRRYESASGLAADVERYLNDEPVQACPPSASYRLRKFLWRYKGSVVAAALVFSALVIGVIGTTIGLVRALDAEQLAEDRSRDLQQANASTTLALDDAKQARIHTEQTLTVSEQRRTAAERSLYFQNIAKAHFEWWNNDVGRADQVLDQCALEYRNWEWRYLKGLCHSELFAFRGHTDVVNDVAFSPDGLHLASASKDRTVKVWELETGRALLTLRHKEPVQSLCFSPDGRLLAASGGDWGSGRSGEFKVWELATGRPQVERNGHLDLVTGVAFHPDGKVLASAGFDKTVKLWDVDTGQEIRTLPGHTGPVRCVVFSPDGQRIASGSGDKTIKVWDTSNGTALVTLQAQGDVACLAFSPDSTRLLSGDYSGVAKVWRNLDAGGRYIDIRGHVGVISGAAFSPDGQQVATGSADGSARLWGTKTGEELRVIRGHTGGVFGVAFSPGGGCLATCGWDRTVKVFDAQTSRAERTLSLRKPAEGFAGSSVTLAFSPDGKRLATVGRANTATYETLCFLQVWDAATSELLVRVSRPRGFMSVAFSPDGKRLATDWGADIMILDAATGSQSVTLSGHAKQIRAVAFNPVHQQLASGGDDDTIKIWNVASTNAIQTLSGHCQAVTAIAFHPAGKLLASTGRDGTWKLWEPATGRAVFTGHADSGALNWVTFSPTGEHFATAGQGGTVRIWATQTGDVVRSLPAHVGPVTGVSYSADGLRLASSGWDGKVRVWDTQTWQEALTLKGRSQGLHSVAFCPKGRYLAAGHVQLDQVRIWDKTDDPPDRHAGNVLTEVEWIDRNHREQRRTPPFPGGG